MKLPLLVAGFLLRREDTSSPKAIDVDLVAPRSAKADLYLSPIEVLLGFLNATNATLTLDLKDSRTFFSDMPIESARSQLGPSCQRL